MSHDNIFHKLKKKKSALKFFFFFHMPMNLNQQKDESIFTFNVLLFKKKFPNFKQLSLK